MNYHGGCTGTKIQVTSEEKIPWKNYFSLLLMKLGHL